MDSGDGLELTFASGSKLETIGNYAFSNTKLAEIELPGNLESIGRYLFKNCNLLTKVTLSSGSKLQTIAERAFEDSMLQSIAIPANVTIYDSYPDSAGNTIYI